MRVTPILLTLAAAGFATGADATLDICNESGRLQSVAIGYQTDEGWTSEGWWNVEPGNCARTRSGELDRRYYYYRAEADGTEFEDEGYYFCTTPQAFTILGDQDCESRGYEREGFREIDTGPEALHYTLTLTATGATGAAGATGPTPPPAAEPEPEPEPDVNPAPSFPALPAPGAEPEPEPEPVPAPVPALPSLEPEPEPEPEPAPEPDTGFGAPEDPRAGGSRL